MPPTGTPSSPLARHSRRAADEIEARTTLETVHWRVEPRRQIDLAAALEAARADDGFDASDPVAAMTDAAYGELEARGELTGSCCHLLLPWRPFDRRLGYGTSPASYRRLWGESGDALTVANVGATETWDGRAVTTNIAVHEVLHTLLSPAADQAVVGVGCDHNLGAVRELEAGVREVSPMATAYAGAGTGTSDTRFSGTGCGHHADFYRHDGLEGVEHWVHTTRLSEGVLEGVSRYVAETFGAVYEG
ncbi:hypothetical protein ACFQMM_09990 [Saliphagus sp. GCM10025308]